MHLSLWFKWTANQMRTSCIISNSIIFMPCSCIILCIALIVFSLVCRYLSPLDRRGSTMSSMTPMKSYAIFRSARQAKPPCSFRYNPTLSLLLSFTALGQQRFICYLLRQLNPFILCMTYHCHSKQMKPTSMSRSCLSPDVPTHSSLFVMPAIAQSCVRSDSSGMNWRCVNMSYCV